MAAIRGKGEGGVRSSAPPRSEEAEVEQVRGQDQTKLFLNTWFEASGE